MDRHPPLVRQQKHDHLEEIAGAIGSDEQQPRSLAVRIEIDHDERVINGVANLGVRDPVPASRSMNIHTGLS